MAPVGSAIAFHQRLSTESKRVLIYENRQLQERAKSCIPLSALTIEARRECASDCPSEFKDSLLVRLLNWFKNNFFTWFDSAKCPRCEQQMAPNGVGTPTRDDLMYGAQTIELYRCQSCGGTERFPRYNDPGKLLETRRGRCGEWANCFTLMCRSLDFDARYILDWTDHVWTEVYSEKLGRWLHCDSCEAVCDKPLIYEAGWGKKLNYVIAFSKDEVQDVTWRYAANHREILKRRTLLSEDELLRQTSSISLRLQSSLSRAQKEKLIFRLVKELAEFLLPQQSKPGELQGRTSGDVNWRKSRGELGLQKHRPVVWIPSETELEFGEFCLEYSCSSDQYVRRSHGNELIPKWSSGVFHADDVFRKVEQDWNVTYLARTEGSARGKISWKFDLSSFEKLIILQVCVSCPGTTYEDGSLSWTICGPDSCQMLPNGCVDYEVDLSGSKWCVLSVEMEKGKGNVAWQHAQIARQSIRDRDVFPLSFRVLFGSAD
nr:EOG090X06HD [Sida crystallina]